MTGAGDDWVVEEPDEPLEPEEVVPPEGVLEDVIGAVAAAVVACANGRRGARRG